jgi:O-antigen ligase
MGDPRANPQNIHSRGMMIRFSMRTQTILLAVYIFVFIAAYDIIGYSPILTSPVRLYFADIILFFMVILALRVLLNSIVLRRLQSPITMLLIINMTFGLAAVFIGLKAGNTINNVLGDFRRFFLYPLVALITISILIRQSDLKKLVVIFGSALFILGMIGLVRFATGKTWDPDQFGQINAFRAIGYFSGALISIGVGVMYAISICNRGFRKYASLAVVFLFEAVLLASGYRLLWAAGICIPLFVAYLSSHGARKGLRLLGIGAILLLLLTGLVLVAQSIFPDVYDRVVSRFSSGLFNLDFSTDVRYYAWKAAWLKFRSSPIVGVGIGDQFQFLALSSTGRFYLSTRTTHNILMSLLYQTGIIGGGLFLAIHISFSLYVWRGLSKLGSRARVYLLGMLAGYFAAMVMGMFQPLFESPGAIVILYLWMGLVLNLLRMFKTSTNERAI